MAGRIVYALVASGAQVSNAFPLGLATAGVGQLTIWCPVVTSGDLRLLGSFDQTSANFLPIHDSTSASLRVLSTVGAGSKAITIGPLGVAYAKLDLSVAQAAPRSFAIINR